MPKLTAYSNYSYVNFINLVKYRILALRLTHMMHEAIIAMSAAMDSTGNPPPKAIPRIAPRDRRGC